MKKGNVLQLSFVLVGLVMGILWLPDFFTSLVSIFLSLFSVGDKVTDFFLYTLITVSGLGIQIFVCYLLIIKSGKFAAFIYKKSVLKPGFNIISKPSDLLHIVLVAIGIYLLLKNLSPLVRNIFQSFKDNITAGVQNLYKDTRPVDWTTLIFNLILPLILLMFAKPIADYFAKNISNDPVSIEESFDATALPEPNED